jgi:CRISP-associated protein Cas1
MGGMNTLPPSPTSVEGSLDRVMVTASQLSTFLFCPRRLFLEAVLGERGTNEPSEEGRYLHDKLASEELYLESDTLGLCGKLDVLHEEGIPVEYKRGQPRPDGTPWPAHTIQLCAMGLLMEDVYQQPISYGYLWYNLIRQRLRIPFDADLREKTLQTLSKARALLSDAQTLPPPIDNRKACLGCNQYHNCLPDESQGRTDLAGEKRILAPHTEGQPLYLDRAGSRLYVRQGTLRISHPEEASDRVIGLERINHIILQQPVHCSSGFLEECLKRGTAVGILDYAGRWAGTLVGPPGRNVLVRQAQFRQFEMPETRLVLSQTLVQAKCHNQRVYLRRHLGPEEQPVSGMTALLKKIPHAKSLGELMGLEGNMARLFFEGYEGLIKETQGFEWSGRNKRPAPDPLNALLSFGYSILMNQAATACHLAGLDPYLGFYHGLKHGKPALALDLMEIFRTPIVDATVLGFINRGQCKPDDFETIGSSCRLKEATRKLFVKTLFERLQEPIKHPIFGYECTYQRAIHIEARLVSYALLSGLDLWRPFTWR